MTALWSNGFPYEWAFPATRENLVPLSVLRAAAAIKVAVVDTGCDVSQPDLAAKSPEVYSVAGEPADVRDYDGHGTFVASLAAGSVTNGDGIAGFGGDARLLCVRVAHDDGSISAEDEAAGIVYAIEHGARVINLSLAGPTPSKLEAWAIRHAVQRGALVVAAAGNVHGAGNRAQYPAALLQRVGSRGRGGVGLAVAASTVRAHRASFSNTGSYVSLAAPGENVFSALSRYAHWTQASLPGSRAGIYGFASGTSFAAAEVSGAAVLVWAANRALTAAQVAAVLKRTASGHGAWTAELGFGVIDVAAAVKLARTMDRPAAQRLLRRFR